MITFADEVAGLVGLGVGVLALADVVLVTDAPAPPPPIFVSAQLPSMKKISIFMLLY